MDLIDKMRNVEIDEKQISVFEERIAEKLADMSREDIIKKFVSMEFNRFLDYYRNASDINVDASAESEGRREKGKRDRGGKEKGSFRREKVKYSRLFVSLGTKDDLTPAKMMGFTNRIVNNRDVIIGQIDIMRNFSFFEVDTDHEKEVVDAMNGANFDGREISVEVASSTGAHEGREKDSVRDRNKDFDGKKRKDRKEHKERRRDNESRSRRRHKAEADDFFHGGKKRRK